MRFKIFVSQIMILAAAQVGVANETSSTFSPHGDMDCTLCHISKPILEVDTIETAPLLAGFSCTKCHQQELGQESESSTNGTCPSMPFGDLTFCDLVGIGAEFDWDSNTWCFTVDFYPPSGSPIYVGMYVPCKADGTSDCGKTCYVSDPGSGCGFGFSTNTFSKCISQFCFLSGFNPPFTSDPYSLPFRDIPYRLHGYMIWDNECDDAMDYQYSCCTVEFGGLELVLTVPSEVQAGDPWQMIIEAQDTHGNVMTDYLGTVSFSVSQDKSFIFGPPKSGTDLPEYYHFEEDDEGRHVFDFVSYSEGPVDITVSDLWVDAQATVTVLPGEPNCTKTQFYDPPPPVDPPDPINPLSSVVVKNPAPSRKSTNSDDEFRLMGGGGGYTVVNICPPISVTPEYLPADGVSEAVVNVGTALDPITDSFGNPVNGGFVTVESTVGDIVSPDAVPDPGTPGIQIPISSGIATFSVKAGTMGMQGVVTASSLSGVVLSQHSLILLMITSETVATVPTNRARTKVGVGEEVVLSFQPVALSPVSWSVSGSGVLSAATGNPVTFTAHDRASTTTITATFSGYSSTITFNVVEPDGIEMLQEPGSKVWHIINSASVGFLGRPFITPHDVSFINIEWREYSCTGIGTGFYSDINGQQHAIYPWITVSPGISTKPSMGNGYDEIGSGAKGPPYSIGSFTWPIPWQFRVNGGSEKVFSTVAHQHDADALGTVTIDKGGIGFVRQASDTTSGYW